MRNQLARLLEHSLTSMDDGVDQDASALREQDIRELENPAKRFGALAVHKFVELSPETAQRLQNGLLRTMGLVRIGEGAEAVVFRTTDGVLKLYKGTSDTERVNQVNFINNRNRTEVIASTIAGRNYLRHRYSVEDHPIKADTSVVHGRQAFVEFNPDDSIFPRVTCPVDLEHLERLERSYPGSVRELADLAQRFLERFSVTGFLPDTHGADNLVIGRVAGGTIPEVLLIDAHLETGSGSHLAFYPFIESQLKDLHRAPSEIL